MNRKQLINDVINIIDIDNIELNLKQHDIKNEHNKIMFIVGVCVVETLNNLLDEYNIIKK